MLAQLVTNTFAHPFTLQVIFLWLAVVPIILIGVLIVMARIKGDRSLQGPSISDERIKPVQH